MRKIFLTMLAALTLGAAQAQDRDDSKFYGMANRWSIAAGVGTEGIGFEVGTHFNRYLGARVGLNIMPGISYADDIRVDLAGIDPELKNLGFPTSAMMNVEGSLSRTTVDVKLDVYPFASSFFITGGFSFSGNKIIKVTGHSQEVADAWARYGSQASSLGIQLTDVGVQIDDYFVPIDANGDISGGLKVSGFRPYLGLGFGRTVPKNRIGFRVELGAQFHGSPEFYVDNGNFTQLRNAADDDVSEAIDFVESIKVYPVLKFTLRGRIL